MDLDLNNMMKELPEALVYGRVLRSIEFSYFEKAWICIIVYGLSGVAHGEGKGPLDAFLDCKAHLPMSAGATA